MLLVFGVVVGLIGVLVVKAMIVMAWGVSLGCDVDVDVFLQPSPMFRDGVPLSSGLDVFTVLVTVHTFVGSSAHTPVVVVNLRSVPERCQPPHMKESFMHGFASRCFSRTINSYSSS